MKKYIVLIALPFLLSGIANAHTVADSVGVEKKNGKRFILHRVDQNQTLYSIARRYSSSVAAIKAANPSIGDAVRYTQVVRIPIADGSLSRKEEKTIDKAIRKEEKAKEKEAKNTPDAIAKASTKENREARKSTDPAKVGIHVVEPGQTLYSLAVRYGIAQSDLRKWNSLPGNNVLIGQALIVSEKAYLARTPAAQIAAAAKTPPPAHTETPAKTPPKPERPAPKKPEETAAAKTEPAAPKPENPAPTKPDNVSSTSAKTEEVIEIPHPGNDAPMPTRGRRLATSGVAEMIEGDGSGKYLALHRTAPIGTLVQVRNEFNNQSLWVKVIGRLPNTGVNDKILVKLSAQAFAKLSPQDRRFRAEVSYIAP